MRVTLFDINHEYLSHWPRRALWDIAPELYDDDEMRIIDTTSSPEQPLYYPSGGGASICHWKMKIITSVA